VPRVVVEGVTHGERLWHLVRPNFNCVFVQDSCVRPMPFSIRAGDRELVELIAVANLTVTVSPVSAFPQIGTR